MKIERCVTDVTSVRTPARVELDILGMIFDVFWPVQATIVVGESLCVGVV